MEIDIQLDNIRLCISSCESDEIHTSLEKIDDEINNLFSTGNINMTKSNIYQTKLIDIDVRLQKCDTISPEIRTLIKKIQFIQAFNNSSKIKTLTDTINFYSVVIIILLFLIFAMNIVYAIGIYCIFFS